MVSGSWIAARGFQEKLIGIGDLMHVVKQVIKMVVKKLT